MVVKGYNAFDNDCEQIRLTAVNRDGWAIQFIDTPSDAVQLEAVKQKRND